MIRSSLVHIHKVLNQKKSHTCKFLQYGLVSYKDMGAGVALLNKETIDKMLPSMVGVPVTILHPESDEQIPDEKVGFVTHVWWNPDIGWYECSFETDDDDAEQKIAEGFSVSCGFNVDQTGKGGEWHAIKYQEEILNGLFTHLALVPNPRYEDSVIYQNAKVYVNSKEGEVKRENSSEKDAALRKLRKEKQAFERAGDKEGAASVQADIDRVEREMTNAVQNSTKEYCPKCRKEVEVTKDMGISSAWIECTECGEVIRYLRTKLNSFKLTTTKNNAKETNPMFAFLRKMVKGKDGKEVVQERKLNAVESRLNIDGEDVSIKDLLATYKAEEIEKAAKEEMLAMENEVSDEEGAKYKVGDLVDCYRRSKGASKKKNEKPEGEEGEKKEDSKPEGSEEEGEKKEDAKPEEKKEDSKPAEEEEDEKKEDSKPAEEEGGEKKEDSKPEEEKPSETIEKKNSKGAESFRLINSARESSMVEDSFAPVAESASDKVARGKARYGQERKK